MILSKASQQAILVLTYIGLKSSKTPILSNELGSQLNMSKATLCQILNILRKNGLLVSKRGPRGGYLLKKNFHEIKLAEILRVTDVLNFQFPIHSTMNKPVINMTCSPPAVPM